MITIKYSEGGQAYSDFNLDAFIKMIKLDQVDNFSMKYEVSTSNIIYAVKLAVVRGDLDPEQIQFDWQGQIITVNKFGSLNDWPKYFADIDARMCEEIIRSAIKMRKKEKALANENKG